MKTLCILTFSLCISILVSAQMPTAGLVAWYPFSGSAADASGNGNNGTVNGATLTTDRFGAAASAYSFNGTSSNISGSTLTYPTGNSARTVSAWFAANSAPGVNYSSSVLGYGATSQTCNNIYGLLLWAMSTPTKRVGSWKSCTGNFPDVATPYNYTLTNWYHLVATYNGVDTEKIYVNDSLISINSVNSLNTITGVFRIGSAIQSNSYFDGKIDDVAIYNRVLTACEVHKLYDTTLPFTSQPSNVSAPTGTNTKLVAHASSVAVLYQWQQNSGVGFINLSNAGPYSGVNTDTLKIAGVTVSMSNYLFRCILSYPNRGCGDTSFTSALIVTPTTPTGISTALAAAVHVYPNPFCSEIVVSADQNKLPDGISVLLSDITGRTICAINQGTVVANNAEYHIPTSRLQAGFYTISIYQDGLFVSSQKMVKQ